MTTYATPLGPLGEELDKPEDKLQVSLAIVVCKGDVTIVHEAITTVYVARRKRRQIGEEPS